MRKTPPFFVLILLLCVNQTLLSDSTSDIDANILLGQQYAFSNCIKSENISISTSVDFITEDYTYFTWHSFRTPQERSIIEFDLTALDLGENSSVAIYNEFKSSVVWSTDNLSRNSVISTKLVNLYPNSSYYILVSSDEQSQGSYLLELNISATPPPPTNDLCEGATSLGSLTCGDFMFFEADPNATPDPEATGNCISNTEPAQWYTFTTPNPLEFSSMYNNILTSVELFSTTSGCDGLVYEDCFSGIIGDDYGFNFEPGTTYYFLVSGDFYYSIPWFYDSSCEDPYWDGSWWWWWDNEIEFWTTTDCAEPSGVVPCQNDHVIWYEFTTDCVQSDVSITVNNEILEEWWWNEGTAEEISITAIADDCSTLLAEYDANGLGYVCSALGSSEPLILENLPPNFTFLVAFGSSINELGHFGVIMYLDSDGGEVENDICSELEVVDLGLNTDLSNLCATYSAGPFDALIPGCAGQSDATVWYEFDPGVETQDVTINLISQGINAPAIAAFDGCVGDVLASNCGNTLELSCIDAPILIEVGSATDNAGEFELEIATVPSPPPLIPEITENDICSGEVTDIVIDIPGGSFVDINVSIGPGSSSFVTGSMNQTFNGVNSVSINQELTNTSSTVQEVIYIISVSTPAGLCASEDVEVSILVNPAFEVTPEAVEECLPYLLELDVNDVITGGSQPYSSISWYWNGTDLLSNNQQLSFSIMAEGQITLEVIDNAGCTASTEIDIEILDVVLPSFGFPLSYCRPEQDFIAFPDISLEGIEGTWNTPLIDLSQFTMNGFIDLTFTPDETYCSFPIDITIEITEGEEPLFDLPSVICADDDLYVFPTEDLNGVAGTWDDPFIDLSTAVGVQFNTFTPFTSQECLSTFVYEFEVGNSIELDFGEPDILCRSDAPVELSSSSLDGFEGSWDASVIDPGLVAGDVFTATWTPFEGQSPCIGSTTIMVSIVEPVVAEFTLPEELCKSEEVYTFPLMDEQSISGSWSIDTIDLAEAEGTVESVFTADDGCVQDYTWEIEVVEPLVPGFNLETDFCALDAIYTLPTTSDNGIEGNWSQPDIDPSTLAGEQVTVEFLGTPAEACVEPLQLTFEISEAVDPAFTLPEKLCWEDENLILPTNSSNAISGSWEPAIIDVQSNLGTMVTSTFTPENGSCSNVVSASFEVVSPFDVEVIGSDPTGCEIEDGSIEVEALQGSNLEFSLDNGLSWQTDNTFSELSAGGYTVWVRSPDFTSCQLELNAFLNSNDAPLITEVASTDISSCVVENGSIVIDAEGANLEYSIDEGANWQGSNEFTDLPAGSYEISIREAMSDCIVVTSAMIADFPITEIMMVNTEQVSDCNMTDGQIEILAVGEALEYSIDNGENWSEDNLFSNLPSGSYMIQVRSSIGNDCLDSDMVELVNPDQPSLISWDAQNPTLCQPTTGSVEVAADGNNLEYSIDGGLTWQEDNLFTELLAGDYQLIVRDREKVNCTDEALIQIIDEYEALPESVIDVVLPSDCDTEDGSMSIVNSEPDVEYSIDEGLSWQAEPEFTGLASGTYQVVTRKAQAPDCRIIQEAVIPEPDCPCGDLVLEFAKDNLNCSGSATSTVEVVSVQGMSNPEIDVLWQDGTQGQLNENVSEGWQYVTIGYDEYCEWLDSIYVEVLEPIQYEWEIQDLDCPDAKNGFVEIINVAGGSGNYQYSLDGESYQLENVFTDLAEGSYQIYVRDDTDCLTENELDISSEDKIEVSLSEIETINLGESVLLSPGVDVSRIDGFIWSDGTGWENTSELNLEVSPTESTIYSLEVFYGDCSESREVAVEVVTLEKEGIHMGNAFSPNGDGINDQFFIQGGANSSIELNGFIILDRWGNKMFTIEQPRFNNTEDGWDGFYQGDRVSPGVYIYQIMYSEDGRSEIQVGTVTIVD